MKVPKVVQLPSGSWCCRVMVNGKSFCVTRETPQEAQQDAIRIKLGEKTAERLEKRTLSEAYQAYIASRADVLSPSTVAGYRRLNRNTFQSLMPLNASAITSRAVQGEVSRMRREGKSPKYIANAYGLLVSVLRSENPELTLNVRLPQRFPVQQRQLSPEEIARLIKGAYGDPIEIPVLMGLWLGMRLSEIRGARYGDITNRTLHIHTAVVDDENGRAVEKTTKTASGDRYVPLPDYLLERIGTPAGREKEFIVPYSGQAIYKRFSRLCEQLEIPHCRFHDLRHANAAVMVRLGVESRYAQERNGWASDRMFKQVYAYAMQDQQEAVAHAIDEYFESLLSSRPTKEN